MKTLWILIFVNHGLIQEPELFSTKKEASIRKREIMKNFNSDYDEIEIFEKEFH